MVLPDADNSRILSAYHAENMRYLWERTDWPRFRWDAETLLAPLADARNRQGRLLGTMSQLGFDLKIESELQATIEDVLKTSEIEGEALDLASVRSSVARRLGVSQGGASVSDRTVDGVVEMVLDATQHHGRPLTVERLWGWHAALFPTGYSGVRKITVADWRTDRDGPMRVVSGPMGKERVHFEAPPAERVASEMERFVSWFAGRPPVDCLLRSGVAHLWFVTIHPLDDGNGRIARAIADLALAQMEGTGQRFYSVSAQIMRERSRYYRMLETAQRGTLDITEWLAWFIACFGRAIDDALTEHRVVLGKAEFWRRYAHEAFSARQKAVLNRVLHRFVGKLTAKKWASLGKCSVATAQRDINDLLSRGLLTRNPGGSKRTSYTIAAIQDRQSGS